MKTTVLRLIEEQIAQESSYIKEHEQIRAILKPLEGQVISGRVLNKHKLSTFEVDNGYPFTLKPQYGMFYIAGKYEHLIGYDSEPVIMIDKTEGVSRGFEYFDACHGSAAQERINQLKGIDINLLTSVFSKVKKNFEGLCTTFGDIERANLGSFYNPIYYQLLNAIKPDEKDNRGPKLSDFYFIRK